MTDLTDFTTPEEPVAPIVSQNIPREGATEIALMEPQFDMDRAYGRPNGPRHGPVSSFDKIGASFSKFSILNQASDVMEINNARRRKAELDVPDDVLVHNLPTDFRAMVMEERNKNGGAAAMILRKQIRDDIDNNTIFDNLAWYEAIGYGAVGLALDPTTWISGAGALNMGIRAGNVIRKASFLGRSAPKFAQQVARHTTTAFTESAMINLPRLAGDHTYNMADLENDILIETVAGAVLSKGLSVVGARFRANKQRNRVNNQLALDKIHEVRDRVESRGKNKADVSMQDRVNEAAEMDLAIGPKWVDEASVSQPAAVTADNLVTAVQRTTEIPASGPIRLSAKAVEGAGIDSSNLLALNKRVHRATENKQRNTDNGIVWLQTGMFDAVNQLNASQVIMKQTMKQASPSSTATFAGVIADIERGINNVSSSKGMNDNASAEEIADAITDILTLNKRSVEVISQTFEEESFATILRNVSGSRIDSKSLPASLGQIPIGLQKAQSDAIRRVSNAIAFSKSTIKYGDNLASLKAAKQAAGQVGVRDIRGLTAIEFTDSIANLRRGSSWWDSPMGRMITAASADDASDSLRLSAAQIAHRISDEDRYVVNAVEEALKDTANLSSNLRKVARASGAAPQRTAGWKVITAISKQRETHVASAAPRMTEVLTETELVPEAKIAEMADAIDEAYDEARELAHIAQKEAIEGEESARVAAEMVAQAERNITTKTGNIFEDTGGLPSDKLQDPKVADEVAKALFRQSFDKLTNVVADYHAAGQHQPFIDAVTPANWKQMAAKSLAEMGGLTKDLTTKFIESKSPTLNWNGTHLTELGQGLGGSATRRPTSAVIRELEYTRSLSQIMPAYDKDIRAYAAQGGSGRVGQLFAAVESGNKNKVVQQFNKDFMIRLNNKRLGKSMEPDEVMDGFIAAWTKYMDYNYNTMVKANIDGWTGNNQRKFYAPQVWNIEATQRALNENPEAFRELLVAAHQGGFKGVESHIDDDAIDGLIKYLRTAEDDINLDQYIATQDSRSLARMDFDWDTEVNGVRLLDMLDTNVASMATSYSNRVAGWVGISKATNGVITGHTDLEVMKFMVHEETGDMADVQLLEDVHNMLFGKEVRGGLSEVQRSLKVATTVSRMGSLGSTQLIETGTVLSRSIMEWSADPKFMKKLTKGLSPEDTAEDLRELMNLTGYKWDYELMNRQSEFFAEGNLAGTEQLKHGMERAVDLATGGRAVTAASGILGKVTGYNAVRKYQSAVMQRSYAMQVTRQFALGRSKLSPARLADWGLSDINGNNSKLTKEFQKHVEFDSDGYPTKYNFDKWDDDVRDTFMYGLQRAEAQDILRPLVGEMPAWFNRPLAQIVAQFRVMPIVAQNKALGRSIAMADKEAVVQWGMNAMTAGAVRGGKIALLAAGYGAIKGTDWQDEFWTKENNISDDALAFGAVDRYMSQAGLWADAVSLATTMGSANSLPEFAEKAAGQIPVLGYVKDVVLTGKGIVEQDSEAAIKHGQGAMLLGNTVAMEMLATLIEEQNKE